MVHLFALLPASSSVQASKSQLCRRLCPERNLYITQSRSLRQAFLSIKACATRRRSRPADHLARAAQVRPGPARRRRLPRPAHLPRLLPRVSPVRPLPTLLCRGNAIPAIHRRPNRGNRRPNRRHRGIAGIAAKIARGAADPVIRGEDLLPGQGGPAGNAGVRAAEFPREGRLGGPPFPGFPADPAITHVIVDRPAPASPRGTLRARDHAAEGWKRGNGETGKRVGTRRNTRRRPTR